MKRTLAFLLIFLSVSSFAQPIVTTIKRAPLISTSYALRDSSGYLKRIDITNRETLFKVLLSSVTDWKDTMRVYQTRSAINSDTITRPDISAYYVRRVGHSIGTIGQTGLFDHIAPSLRSQSDFSDSFSPAVLYDGSVWYKITGVRSTTEPGYGAVYVNSTTGSHYHRQVESYANLKWWKPVGDGYANDSAAVARAVSYVTKAITFPDGNMTRKLTDNPGTLLVPIGTYKIKDVWINGSIKIKGEGGGTYGESMFKADWNHNGFILGVDGDNQSNSTTFEDLGFSSSQPVSVAFPSGVPPNVNVAHIIGNPNGKAANSIAMVHCWFQTIENKGIWTKLGGDIRITGCDFDVSGIGAIHIHNAQDVRISNNLFYNVSNDHIILDGNVERIAIINNQAFINAEKIGVTPNSQFVTTGTASVVTGLDVSHNTTTNLARFGKLETTAKGARFANNTMLGGIQYFLALSGGGVTTDMHVTGNYIEGVSTWAFAPITGTACGVQRAIIKDNHFISTGGATAIAINLPDGRTTGNIVKDNQFSGFTTNVSVANSSLNTLDFDPSGFVRGDAVSRSTNTTTYTGDIASGFNTVTGWTGVVSDATGYTDYQRVTQRTTGGALKHLTWNVESGLAYFGGTNAVGSTQLAPKRIHDNRWFPVDTAMAGVSAGHILINNGVKWSNGSPSSVRTALGLGTAAQANSSAFIQGTNNLFNASVTNSFTTTASWSTTAYTSVVTPATLTNGLVYLVKCVWTVSGVDTGVQSWLVPISGTINSSGGTTVDLVGNYGNYIISPARYFKLRLQKPTSGGGTFGLEAAVSDASMINSSASVVFTLTPIF